MKFIWNSILKSIQLKAQSHLIIFNSIEVVILWIKINSIQKLKAYTKKLLIYLIGF